MRMVVGSWTPGNSSSGPALWCNLFSQSVYSVAIKHPVNFFFFFFIYFDVFPLFFSNNNFLDENLHHQSVEAVIGVTRDELLEPRVYVVARWRHSAAVVAHLIFFLVVGCCRLKLNGSQARSIPINFTYTTKCIFHLLLLLVASSSTTLDTVNDRTVFFCCFRFEMRSAILCLSIVRLLVSWLF